MIGRVQVKDVIGYKKIFEVRKLSPDIARWRWETVPAADLVRVDLVKR